MLYLCGDTIIGPIGIQCAQMDPEAVVVLIKDGVYLDPDEVPGKKVYAIDVDVQKRGMADRLKYKAEIIGYDRLVDLVFEKKVANFV